MSAVYNNYCLGRWHSDCDGQARDGVCLCPCHKEARDRKIKITNEEYFTLDDPTENKVEGDDDPVNHPQHYTSDPSGVECIEIVRHRNFNVGNAIKYLWRAGLKTGSSDPLSKQIEDLEKARWYIADEIQRLRGESQNLKTDFQKRWSELQERNKEAFTEEIARNYVEYKDEEEAK